MGDLRYVAAPIGILRAEEMPARWGLLEVTKRQVRVTKEAEPMKAHKGRECVMLMSALRRVELSTAVYVVAEDQSTANAAPHTGAVAPSVHALVGNFGGEQ